MTSPGAFKRRTMPYLGSDEADAPIYSRHKRELLSLWFGFAIDHVEDLHHVEGTPDVGHAFY